MVSFSPSATLAGEPAFRPDDVIRGVPADPALQERNGWVWVELAEPAECLRCYGALAGHREALPLIFFEGDVIDRGNHLAGDIVIRESYPLQTPFLMQAEAEQIASALSWPFVNLARPGVFGSSGHHGERRREREVAVVDRALDRLKAEFGWGGFTLAGLPGGWHLIAALMARRSDIDCAVIASGNVAVRQRNAARGLHVNSTGYADFVDPIELVAAVARKPPRRIIVLTDPQDSVVTAACQGVYVQALRQAGVKVEQRFVTALDPRHHILRIPALLAASSAG